MALDNSRKYILVVDDSADTRELLQRNLSSQGYEVQTADNVSEALKILASMQIDLVITDLKMPGVSGLDLVKYVRENLKDTEVMMITGYPSVEGAVAAVKSGAEEYLSKPFTKEELLVAIGRVMEKLRLRQIGSAPIERRAASAYGIVGNSDAMQKVYKAISTVASQLNPILIAGENGTGKELVAKAIHRASPRARAAFIYVNCMGNLEEFFEKQLFGCITDTSPGRTESRTGFFQFADGGTLYLKGIAELPEAIQSKLLHVLAEKEFRMIGSTDTQAANFLLISDADNDLRMLVNKGTFREDLFIRLSMNAIAIPPLRERGDDALLLARHFLDKFCREMGRSNLNLSDRALEIMRIYSWPGNVAELKNLMQQLVLKVETDFIDVPDFPAPMRHSAIYTAGLNRSLAELEIEHIHDVIANVKGNKTQAAEILGITRKTLREKLKQARHAEPHL